MLVEKVLSLVMHTPLGKDRTAAGNDSGHPFRGVRNERTQNSGVNRKVIYSLLSLFNKRIAEQLPSQIFDPPSSLFQSLIDGNRTDRHRTVTHNPLARGMDIFSGRKIHDRVSAPLGRPPHLFDFLINRRGHRRVTDVRVDLHQKIAANNHWLTFGMVDVKRNNRPPSGHLGTYKFRCNVSWNHCAP